MVENKSLFYNLKLTSYIVLALITTTDCSVVKHCQFGQYWSTVLLECRPCSDVCEPPTRLSCWDHCPGVYFRQKIRTSATTPLTETTRTMPQPVTVDNSFNNVHLRNVVIGLSLLGGFAFLFSGFLVCYIYIPKRNARRRKREDAENVNDENGIELQPLRGTAEPEPSGTPVLDRNGDNQQHDATGTLIGAAFYERDRDCIRIDRLESLPAQRAQQPEVQEQKHSYP